MTLKPKKTLHTVIINLYTRKDRGDTMCLRGL